MKTLQLSIIATACIVVIGIIVFAIILSSQPKRIAGLENDTGMVTLGNQEYYFTTVNDTMTTYQGEGVQESFHGVVFTFFPRPFSGGPAGSCGNTNFGSDVKFPDDKHELLGVGIPGLPCGENYIQTVLSNHTNPQAGLAVYDQKIKLLVSTQNEFAVAPQRSNQTTHYYVNTVVKPKVELYDYYYDGIGRDNATVSINNQRYYQTTLNYDDYSLRKGTSIQFQNVTFAFPEGVMITPGGAFIMLDIKFLDGSEEIYGENKINPDGSGAIGGIGIPTQYGPHLATNSTTVLGNHTMPQAGLTIYNDKIKLLVSIMPQKFSQQLATRCTAGPGMSCNNQPVGMSQKNGTNPNCSNIESETQNRGSSVNEEKAKDLAQSDFRVRMKILFGGYHYTGIFNEWSWDKNCNLTWKDVNVVFQSSTTNIVVSEDPDLTRVISITTQYPTGHY
jgi:hypothetical protein